MTNKEFLDSYKLEIVESTYKTLYSFVKPLGTSRVHDLFILADGKRIISSTQINVDHRGHVFYPDEDLPQTLAAVLSSYPHAVFLLLTHPINKFETGVKSKYIVRGWTHNGTFTALQVNQLNTVIHSVAYRYTTDRGISTSNLLQARREVADEITNLPLPSATKRAQLPTLSKKILANPYPESLTVKSRRVNSLASTRHRIKASLRSVGYIVTTPVKKAKLTYSR